MHVEQIACMKRAGLDASDDGKVEDEVSIDWFRARRKNAATKLVRERRSSSGV